ncbi:hypothetical protein [Roseomonas indoligenes]|uniref:Uncharacterized protein n=1 Tax=Roseomonas indoligenes TaxID=2820811 RepID=A0A940S6K5_9PROT|nr:hypothetical protein [Pararoseomonas indoligenes]MBP0492147.1 hypothetical protein [Pararoseomonas indoligenes]
MSIKPGNAGISAILPNSASANRPLTLMVATKRTADNHPTNSQFLSISDPNGEKCSTILSGDYGYAVLYQDRSGNYGSAGNASVDPGLEMSSFYTAGNWCWWMLCLNSNSSRQFFVDTIASPVGTTDLSAAPPDFRGMPLKLFDNDGSTQFAWISVYSGTVSQADFLAVRAGTKNPRDIAGFYDGSTLAGNLTSFNGLLTFTGSPTFVAGDNPTVAAQGVTQPTGAKLVSAGFSW